MLDNLENDLGLGHLPAPHLRLDLQSSKRTSSRFDPKISLFHQFFELRRSSNDIFSQGELEQLSHQVPARVIENCEEFFSASTDAESLKTHLTERLFSGVDSLSKKQAVERLLQLSNVEPTRQSVVPVIQKYLEIYLYIEQTWSDRSGQYNQSRQFNQSRQDEITPLEKRSYQLLQKLFISIVSMLEDEALNYRAEADQVNVEHRLRSKASSTQLSQLETAKLRLKEKFSDWLPIINQSFEAIRAIFDANSLEIQRIAITALDNHGEQLSTSFFESDATGKYQKDIVDPLIVASLLQSIVFSEHRAGEFSAAAKEFYDRMQSYLYEIASETTGDTLQQRHLTLTGIRRLVELGYLHAGKYRWIDLGAGDGTRITQPVVEALTSLGLSPGALHLVDLAPPLTENQWHKIIQADFIDPAFMEKITSATGEKKLNLLTLLWSPINDLDPVEQVIALKNFTQIAAEHAVMMIDVPAGYVPERRKQRTVITQALNGSLDGSNVVPIPAHNKIEVNFPLGEKEISKHFTLNERFELPWVLVQALGWVMLNDKSTMGLPTLEYVTDAGSHRQLVVLMKIKPIDEELLHIFMKGNLEDTSE